MKRLLSLLLCITLTVSMLPLSAFAEDIPADNSYEIYMDSSVREALPEEDLLLAGYMQQLIYGDISTFGTAAREYLNAVEQSVYTWLKNRIVNVAANGGSTEMMLTPDKITGLAYTWPTGTDVMAQFEAQADMNKVWSALVHDCPYDLYWFDKNRQGVSLGITTTDNGTDVSISQLTFIMPVSMNWRANPTYSTTVTPNVENVKAAAANAAAIVNRHADKDDYSRLLAYKDEICALTDYNTGEITGGIEYVNNSSWQLINVFDGNPDTKVVSEGYARAFQYLCDLSVFDAAKCYTVFGTLDGASHGWNLVTMEDGYTYLVDITNSDTGTAGVYGKYFMAGYDDGGRWSGFVVNGRRYSYVSGILFDIDTLTLAPKDYIYLPRGTVHHGQCGDNAYWFLNENGTLTIDGWGDLWTKFYTEDGKTAYRPWYYHLENVKVIDIQPGITSIPVQGFYMCQYATSVTIPDTVTSVGEMAFYSCMELQELTIPDSVTHIETAAFGNLKSIKKLTISKNITNIPDWAFAYCYALEEVVIPDGVTNIGEYGFYSCNNLKRVTMPSSVTSVGDYAFYAYPEYNIDEVYFKGSEAQWGNITFGEYNENLTGAHINYDYDKDAVFTITAGACENGRVSVDKTTAVYGDTVTITAVPAESYQLVRIFVNGAEIQGNTFVVRGNSTVTAEFIPVPEEMIAYGTCGDNLEWTLSDKFVLTISGTGKMTDYTTFSDVPWAEYAPAIKEIVINNGVTTIGKYAFNSFVSLTKVSIPESVTTIEGYAFYGCISLEGIDLPDSIESMWDYIFQGCKSLKEITLPEKVGSIGFSMFKDCTALEKVVIPDSVKTIGFQAFSNCKSLKNIDLPQHGMFISKNAFSGCTSLESIHVYSDAEYPSFIDESAFSGCTGLKTATLDARYISSAAFRNCTALEEVVINTEFAQLEKIGQSAFADCTKLKTVYIPAEVDVIEKGAFNGCKNLTDVYYESTASQWSAVTIETLNDPLVNANIHYFTQVYTLTVINPENGLIMASSISGAAGDTVRMTAVPDAGYKLKAIIVDGKYISGTVFTITGPHTVTAVFEKTGNSGPVYPDIPDTPPASYVPQYTYVIDVYRLYNVATAEHFYTRNASERDELIRAGWNDEGVAFKAPGDDGVPVYRMYSPVSKYHHYSWSKTEIYDMIDAGWIFEGFAWYSARNAAAAKPVYRLFSQHLAIGVHHYTASEKEKSILVDEGWRYEGAAWYGVDRSHTPEVPETPDVTPTPDIPVIPETPGSSGYTYTVPAYHFDNTVTGEQFYTKNDSERDVLMNTPGWEYVGVDFYLPGDAGQPVYRLLNPKTHYHHYTAHQSEIDALVAGGWVYEGFVWFSAKGESNAIPAYRIYNQNAAFGTHLYTVNVEERDRLINEGWRNEGVGWYGLPKP